MAGAFTPIDVPGAVRTDARGINARGDVVGDYSTGADRRGFMRHQGTFTTLDFPGATSTVVMGIDARRTVVGYHLAPGAMRGFIAQPR